MNLHAGRVWLEEWRASGYDRRVLNAASSDTLAALRAAIDEERKRACRRRTLWLSLALALFLGAVACSPTSPDAAVTCGTTVLPLAFVQTARTHHVDPCQEWQNLQSFTEAR